MRSAALPLLDACAVPAQCASARNAATRLAAVDGAVPHDASARTAAVGAATVRPALTLVRAAGAVTLRRAVPADAIHVHALLQRFVERQVLLPRTLEQITCSIGDFVVATEDGQVVGSAALRRYSADLAEVVALAVAEPLHGAGIGRRLVEMLLAHARVMGVRRVFALTLEAGFFHRLGFATTTVAEFPQKVAADCSSCARRRSCVETTVALTL
jgi:amino-acid N-acetyltransferase